MHQSESAKRTSRGGRSKSTGVLFANDQWVVTPEGLDSPRCGYFIDAERLGSQEGGLLEWPLRMVGKRWVKPKSFLQAFAVACQFHTTPINKDLRARTWAAVREKIAKNRRYKELWPVAAAKLYPENVANTVVEGLVSPEQLLEIYDEIDRMILAEVSTAAAA